MLNCTDKSDDEYVKDKLASLSKSDVIAKEFKYHRTCYQSPRAAAASLSATMDENNEKQEEATLREQCFGKIKSMVEKEII